MKRVLFVCIALIFVIFTASSEVFGEDLDGRLSEYDFSEMEDVFSENAGVSIDFGGMVYDVVKGDGGSFRDRIKELFFQTAFGESRQVLSGLRMLVIIAVLGGVLKNLMSSFGDKDTAEMGFAVCYIMVVGLSMGMFMPLIGLMEDFCSHICNIMTGGIPLMAALITAGSSPGEALAYSGIVTVSSAVVLNCITFVIVPVMTLAGVMCGINCLSEEVMLEKLSELLIHAVSKGIKAAAVIFTFIAGLNRLSSSLGSNIIKRSAGSVIEMVPVAGDIIKGSLDTGMTVLGSIKSGAGIAFIAVIAVYSVFPILRVFITAAAFKLAAGVIQPVCDKRIPELLDSMGDCSLLILGLMFLAAYIFIFSVLVFAAFVTS